MLKRKAATNTNTGAPHPDAAKKPDFPTQLTKRSWKYVLRKTVREFSADQCTDAAAGLVYYAVLALFPALIAIFSVLGVVGQGDAAAAAILGIIQDVAPDAASTLREPIEQIASSRGAGIALITGIALALWSASGYGCGCLPARTVPPAVYARCALLVVGWLVCSPKGSFRGVERGEVSDGAGVAVEGGPLVAGASGDVSEQLVGTGAHHEVILDVFPRRGCVGSSCAEHKPLLCVPDGEIVASRRGSGTGIAPHLSDH